MTVQVGLCQTRLGKPDCWFSHAKAQYFILLFLGPDDNILNNSFYEDGAIRIQTAIELSSGTSGPEVIRLFFHAQLS